MIQTQPLRFRGFHRFVLEAAWVKYYAEHSIPESGILAMVRRQNANKFYIVPTARRTRHVATIAS